MMYFTESGYGPEDPIKLNEEFEAGCDTDDYEAKISRLLRHAYQRLRKENDATRKNWDVAIKCLRRGDHYLLVMWHAIDGPDAVPGERPRGDSMKLLSAGLGIAALGIMGAFIAVKFEPQWSWLRERIPSPNPHVLFGIFITIVLAGFFFPRRVGIAVGWLLDHTFGLFGPKEDEKDSE